jgi:thiol-disulfide isomerase/thioredoxin
MINCAPVSKLIQRTPHQRSGNRLKTCFYALWIFALFNTGLEANEPQQAGNPEAAQKWRIVNYWSEWCVPCRREIPVLNELQAQFASSGTGVTVVGVDFDQNPRSETIAIAERMGIKFPVLTPDEVSLLALNAPSVLPTTYILSPDDRVVSKLIGEQDRAGLLAQLAQLDLIDPIAAEVSMMSIPVGSNSSLSRLVTAADGRVYLSWVSRQDEISTLSYSKLVEGVWQSPQVITSGDDWFVNWADFPSLVVNEDTMAAHWLRMSAQGTYDYDVNATFYNAASQSWGRAITVHKDGVSAEHGFVSMLPMSEGRTFISWLDGRNTRMGTQEKGAEAGHDGHSMGGAMTVRAGIFDRDGNTLNDWQLDGRACDCCQTSAALAVSGPVVVYRDRSDEEIRDIYITRLIDGHWTEPAAVYHDDWKIAGCPVNGPAVTAQGEHMAVVWFSAKDDSPEVKLALSDDSGATFSAPVFVADETTNGRVGATYLASGKIALSWMDTRGESAQLMLGLYDTHGILLERVQVAESHASRRSGFPVITSSGDDVYMTWTDIAGDSQVKVARIRF